MKTLTVANLKAGFSEVLAQVRNGEEVIIEYGKQHEKVAVIIPYEKFKPKAKRKVGLLKGKASCKLKKNFQMTTEELLDL